MSLTLAQIFSALIYYKYYLLFPATVVEGPIVTVIAGFLSAHGIMNSYVVYLVVVAGDLTGDILYYAMGRWGRYGILDKWGKYFGISVTKIKEWENHFANHSGKTILIGKLAHGIGTIFLIAAGVSRVPLGEFMIYSLIGTVPKTLTLLLVGYYFGYAYARLNRYFDWLALAILALAVLLLLVYFAIVRLGRKMEKKL